MTGAPDAAAPLTGKHSAAGRLRAVTLWAWALDCIQGKKIMESRGIDVGQTPLSGVAPWALGM